jgi:sortase A
MTWLQRIFFVVGLMILGYCAADWYNARMQQAKGNRELDRALFESAPYRNPEFSSGKQIPEGGLVGKVEIPKLHLSAIVFQGTNDGVLDRGVGHMDQSALPGQSGNVVLAAHRDSYFRSLKDIQQGDQITVTTEDGPRDYKVESTEIVAPTDVSVAGPTPDPTLTLITCYPFYYIGHAPKRFIVRAKEIDSLNIEAKKIQPIIPPAPVQPPARQKETARVARSPRKWEPLPSRYFVKPTPYEEKSATSADLTYVFRASP